MSHWGLGRCTSRKFWIFNSQEWRFPRFLVAKFGAKWEYVLSKLWLHFTFRWPFDCNIVGPKQKRDRLYKLCKETGENLLPLVTKHKFGIDTGDIHMIWTIYFIKRSETKEKRETKKQIWGVWIELSGVWKSAETCDTRSRRVSW